MQIEKIKVRLTSTGQEIEVVVYSKRAEAIEVVVGEGTHSVRCTLTLRATVLPMPATSWDARSSMSAGRRRRRRRQTVYRARRGLAGRGNRMWQDQGL